MPLLRTKHQPHPPHVNGVRRVRTQRAHASLVSQKPKQPRRCRCPMAGRQRIVNVLSSHPRRTSLWRRRYPRDRGHLISGGCHLGRSHPANFASSGGWSSPQTVYVRGRHRRRHRNGFSRSIGSRPPASRRSGDLFHRADDGRATTQSLIVTPTCHHRARRWYYDLTRPAGPPPSNLTVNPRRRRPR